MRITRSFQVKCTSFEHAEAIVALLKMMGLTRTGRAVPPTWRHSPYITNDLTGLQNVIYFSGSEGKNIHGKEIELITLDDLWEIFHKPESEPNVEPSKELKFDDQTFIVCASKVVYKEEGATYIVPITQLHKLINYVEVVRRVVQPEIHMECCIEKTSERVPTYNTAWLELKVRVGCVSLTPYQVYGILTAAKKLQDNSK